MIHDFIIYGTGLSSKVLALALSKNNFKVLMIRDKIEDKFSSNLVTFISKGTLKYLSKILVKESLFKESENIKRLYCEHLSQDRKSKLEFIDTRKEHLGKIVTNKIINEALNDEINKRSVLIKIIDDSERIPELKENCVEFIDNKGKSHTASLLFYTSSKKNNKIINNFNFVGKELNQEALSVTVNITRKQRNIAYQLFTTDGPIALLPINDENASIVWSLKKNSDYLKIEKEELEIVLRNFFVNHLSDLKISEIQNYELNFSYAKKLFHKNCILIGNIAHNIHPIAGQGFNLSVKDIANIDNNLTRFRSLGIDLKDDQIKELFSDNRKFDNFIFSFGTIAMENIFSSENKFIRFLTSKGLKLINQSKLAKNFFTDKATGRFNF